MTNQKEIINWNLKCSHEEALSVLSNSVENVLLPWFFSKTNIKGFVINSKFYIWPNTLYSGISDICIVGKIEQSNSICNLTAKSKILPPFNLFKQNNKMNWLVGIIMIFSWLLLSFSLITENSTLETASFCLFIPSAIYILIQFNKYIQKPELIDLEKRLKEVFNNYINES